MSKESAQRILDPDRIILIGLLSLLIKRRLIRKQDLDDIKAFSLALLRDPTDLDNRDFFIQARRAEAEINRIFSSFRNVS